VSSSGIWHGDKPRRLDMSSKSTLFPMNTMIALIDGIQPRWVVVPWPASIYVQFALVDRVNQATDPVKQGSKTQKASARGKVSLSSYRKDILLKRGRARLLQEYHLPGRWARKKEKTTCSRAGNSVIKVATVT
jgi:hypothetical protein